MSKAKKLIEGILGESSDDGLKEQVSDILANSDTIEVESIKDSEQFNSMIDLVKTKLPKDSGELVGGFASAYSMSLEFENGFEIHVELEVKPVIIGSDGAAVYK